MNALQNYKTENIDNFGSSSDPTASEVHHHPV